MTGKEKLDEKERGVIEKCGTEPRFLSDLLEEDRQGVFKCKKCGQELFNSETKYESGSGWPSFWDAKNEAVEKKKDNSHGMERTEAICSNCDAHLGHVFNDSMKSSDFTRSTGTGSSRSGPEDKTGKRYCINGISLEFKPEEGEE